MQRRDLFRRRESADAQADEPKKTQKHTFSFGQEHQHQHSSSSRGAEEHPYEGAAVRTEPQSNR